MSGVGLVVNVPVWGDRYVERWLRWSLPSLLAPGNLVGVAERVGVLVQVVTDVGGADRLRDEGLVRELGELVRVEFVELDGLRGGILGMTQANLVSLRFASEAQLPFCFTWADMVWSDGGFGSVVERLLGCRAVLSWSCVLSESGVASGLDASRIGSWLRVSGRQLAGWVLEHPHATLRGSEVGADFVPSGPTNVVWVSPDRSCALVRAHTWQLFGVNFSRIASGDAAHYLRLLAAGRANDSVDTYGPIVGDLSEVSFISDSDEMLAVSVDDESRPVTSRSVSCEPDQTSAMLRDSVRLFQSREWVVPLARYLFTRGYHLHTSKEVMWSQEMERDTRDLAATVAIHDHRWTLRKSVWQLLPMRLRNLIAQILRQPRPSC